jgi:hypothetical protein
MCEATGGRWVLPLDDAYIHQQYARQAALGQFSRYNTADPPSSGNTSFLYPLLLSLAWLGGMQGDSLSGFAFFLGPLCLLGATVLAARLATRLCALWATDIPSVPPHWVGWLAGLLLATNGALLWGFFSGMETGLAVVFFLGTLDAAIASRPQGVALWGGLLALTRPEGMVMVFVIALLLGIRQVWYKSARTSLGWLGIPMLLGLVQPLLNLTLTGSFTASGMRAKSWLYAPNFYLPYILGQVGQWLGRLVTVTLLGVRWDWLTTLGRNVERSADLSALYLPPLLGLVGIACLLTFTIKEWRTRLIGPGVICLALFASTLATSATMMTAEWHYNRYQHPIFSLCIVAGAVGLAYLAHRWGGRHHMAVYLALAVLYVALSAGSISGFFWRYREAVRTTLQQQIRLADWIRQNLPSGARVGVHDSGVIGYYGEHPVYDVVGLTSSNEAADAWRQWAGTLYEAMERSPARPSYFAIYDDIWALPYLLKTDLFVQPLFRVEHQDLAGVTSASDHQTVYRADWRLLNSGEALYQDNIKEIVRGLTLVDSLDVADLHAEREHGYYSWNLPHIPNGFSEVYQLTYPSPPHPEVLDGGRASSGGGAFRLSTRPGEDLVLVGRFLGTNDVWLQVKANGHPAGTWFYPAFEGAWQERALLIPGALLVGQTTEIEIQAENERPGFLWHRSFHYWAFQGSLAERALRIAHPVEALAGDKIRLLGYDLTSQQGPDGWELGLTLYWRAEQPLQENLKVFVHWVDNQDRMLAQHDSEPQDGKQPTWMWQPGFIIADPHRLVCSAPISGPTTLYIGLYEAQTMANYPLAGADAAGRFPLTRLDLP